MVFGWVLFSLSHEDFLFLIFCHLFKFAQELKNELAQLRVAKLSGQGGPSKLAKIKVIRKSIARVLTVYNQTQRQKLLKAYSKRKYLPLDLRKKREYTLSAKFARSFLSVLSLHGVSSLPVSRIQLLLAHDFLITPFSQKPVPSANV